jgi:hypothetical protein
LLSKSVYQIDLSEIIQTTNIREFLVFCLIFFSKVSLGEKAEIFDDGKKQENIVEI